MADTKTKEEVVENEIPVQEAEPFKELTSDKIGNYVVENAQKVLTAIGVVTALFLGYYAYQNMVVAPKNQEAYDSMFHAESAYKRGEFQLAIDGNEKYLGFAAVADDYSGTKAANLANFYAGVSYLQLGQFESAIDYLSSYSSEDLFTETMAFGALGDAYAESGNTSRAIDFYAKAAKNKANDFLTPLFLLKTARAHDLNKDFSKSLSLYKQIKKDYPNSYEGRDIEKFIARAEARVNS